MLMTPEREPVMNMQVRVKIIMIIYRISDFIILFSFRL